MFSLLPLFLLLLFSTAHASEIEPFIGLYEGDSRARVVHQDVNGTNITYGEGETAGYMVGVRAFWDCWDNFGFGYHYEVGKGHDVYKDGKIIIGAAGNLLNDRGWEDTLKRTFHGPYFQYTVTPGVYLGLSYYYSIKFEDISGVADSNNNGTSRGDYFKGYGFGGFIAYDFKKLLRVRLEYRKINMTKFFDADCDYIVNSAREEREIGGDAVYTEYENSEILIAISIPFDPQK